MPKKRQNMAERRNTLERKLADTAAGICSICNGMVPLRMLPDNVDRLRSELLKDIRTAKSQTRREVIHDVFKEIGDVLDSKHAGNENLKDMLKGVRRTMLKSSSRGRRIFDFPLEEMNAMLYDMDAAQHSLADMAKMVDEHKTASDELGKVKSMLDMMPQTDEIGPLFSEISKISREIGEMDGEMHKKRDACGRGEIVTGIKKSRNQETACASHAGEKDDCGY